MNQLGVIGLVFGLLVAGSSRAVADTATLKIPIVAVGAPAPKEVSVDFLGGDRSLVKQIPKVPSADGSLKLSPVPDVSKVRIAAEGFDPVEVPLSNAVLGISLPALSRLIVKWPFKDSSKLPPMVDLYVIPLDGRPPSTKAAALIPGTDTFSALVPPGAVILLLHSSGIGMATSARQEFHPGASERLEKLGELLSRDLLLRVTDPGGHPVPAAYLRFQCQSTSDSATTVGSWLSGRTWRPDPQGRIELRSIPVSACSPMLASKGFRTVVLKSGPERTAGPAVPQTVVLRPLTQLNLEIEPSFLGKEESAEVSLILSETESDAEPQPVPSPPGPRKVWSGRVKGRECVGGLEGGLYRALARAGARTAGEEFVLSGSPDAPDERTVRIRFDPRWVKGRVFVGESPGPHISVEAIANDRRMIAREDEPLASTTTGADGFFEMPVSYAGPLILRARLSEKNLVYQEVASDQDPDKEIVLRGWAGSIIVRAFDAATGNPVSDATVRVTELRNDGLKLTSEQEVPGETTLTGLGSGQLTLRLSSPRHRPEERTLTLRGDEVELSLDFSLTPKLPRVVLVTSERGEPVEGCSVLSSNSVTNLSPEIATLRQVGQTDWSGRVALDDVGAAFVLVFIRPGYSLQLTPSSSLASNRGDEDTPVSVTLPSLREKLTGEAALRLAQSLSGSPTFIFPGLAVPSGLARTLALQSGLNDQSLLLPGAEGLLLWSRLLPPGDYTVTSPAAPAVSSGDDKGKEVASRLNTATVSLN